MTRGHRAAPFHRATFNAGVETVAGPFDDETFDGVATQHQLLQPAFAVAGDLQEFAGAHPGQSGGGGAAVHQPVEQAGLQPQRLEDLRHGVALADGVLGPAHGQGGRRRRGLGRLLWGRLNNPRCRFLALFAGGCLLAGSRRRRFGWRWGRFWGGDRLRCSGMDDRRGGLRPQRSAQGAGLVHRRQGQQIRLGLGGPRLGRGFRAAGMEEMHRQAHRPGHQHHQQRQSHQHPAPAPGRLSAGVENEILHRSASRF